MGKKMHLYRSHTCGQIREGHAGQEVRLSGWCHRIRDHGGLLFLDLRDHYGLVQCVVDPQSPAFLEAEKLRSEWVVRINGKVQLRPEGTENKHLPSGSIEILVTDLEVLGESLELPLPIFGEQDYPEETRLKYRFLDLRRERLHRNIMLRTKVIDSLRHHMKGRGFFEFQTPILTASSPEGARDFLVPSRLHAGKFYALPQAPQQYKQLIMMAGFDRYFQIAPCFRDEDPRADRLPGEFYQLDVEMSFVTQEEIFATIEPVIRAIFEEFGQGKKVTQNFPWISYADSLSKYGSDKPDLRNPIELCDVSEFFRGADFKLFARLLEEKENQIWAIPAKGGGSRTFCDRMNEWAKGEQQPGLGYMFWKENKSMGPIAQNIGGGRAEALQRALHLGEGDAAFFVAGKPEKFMKFIGLARNKIGQELHLTAEDGYYFAWIVDFPLYEWNEEEKRVDFSHNPFSMPQATLTELQSQDPLAIKAFQYDLTCNGYELASGAIRNHRPEIMRQVFALAGYPEPLLEARFGALYRAFHYGAPPHGGLAAGIDRIVMLLAGEQNLREVTLFPMNQQAEDILMGAPSEVLPKQLKELQMQILKER